MRAISSSTVITDPCRAGIALGESLASNPPEVVFLFSSVHCSVPELLEGHGSLSLVGDIAIGHSVPVCLARPDDMVAEVQAIAEAASASVREPAAALVISCSGRKALLGKDRDTCADPGLRTGFAPGRFHVIWRNRPFGSQQSYTHNLFHRATCCC
ncbi:MAG: FIST C-terminal domain-containing protein [Propionivibrio sp.]|uniref:FIST C-terminal domain-containing protein n=1 Tax=Propionivibrio sp. TaxID=2212460 RepID=UPI001A41451A|nr:FIST C-terminal domain-containing protein [Propionivibrio sp.]